MPSPSDSLKSPERWDVPFGPEMGDADVDRLLSIPPFQQMDPALFPPRTPLRGILGYDTRIKRFRRGEIVVRQGDYGSSAFLILTGSVRVVTQEGGLPVSMLGRPEPRRKNFLRVIAQLWANSPIPERFKRSELQQDQALGSRGDGDETHVFLQDIPRVLGKYQTEVMTEGEFFGEMAALTRMPRSRTIFADSEAVELLEIRWQGLRELKRYDKAFDHHIEEVYRQFALPSFFANDPLFRRLSDDVRKALIKVTKFETYGRFDWTGDFKRMAAKGGDEVVVAQEGDYPNALVIVRAGFARLSQRIGSGHRTLNYLGTGSMYGLREMAHNWRKPDAGLPLQYSLRAIGYTHLLTIPTRYVEELILPNLPPKLLPAVLSKEEVQREAVQLSPASGIGENMMEFLAEHRYFNGTASMLIDLDRCTRCDDCVRACAAAHDNNPRFLRHGPIQGNIMVANACMHCADPVCMIGCPTGAIHRETFGGEVVINPITCIGCSACANNCPYDAIRMVEIRDAKGEIIADAKQNAILKATKCDLCVEQQTGPACERACPHGALVRMNMNKLDSFAQWLSR